MAMKSFALMIGLTCPIRSARKHANHVVLKEIASQI